MFHHRTRQSDSKGRDPPGPFLQPSPTGSHSSLPGDSAPVGLQSSSSGLRSNSQQPVSMSSQQTQGPPPLTRTGSLLNPRNRTVARLPTGDSARTADRTDALWAEMQTTLEEAELSASGGTHVFGVDHDRKLAELRVAQIALAQAWARSEADDTTENIPADTEVRNLKGALGDVGNIAGVVAAGAALSSAIPSGPGKGTGDGTDGGRSTIGTGSARPGSSGLDGEKLGAKLEEETERDILLARNRREANDRYFSKVDQGVRDVVEKLEAVSVAMRAVEQETRGIWGEDSAPESLEI
ncbi:hypothetical protein F5Y18DRAFT_369737 [Xylariaceae sp. FL1019]|nr:hypothetical protein F5Y18DRAFT_369737 [Xylariaceae sp. FL1019]